MQAVDALCTVMCQKDYIVLLYTVDELCSVMCLKSNSVLGNASSGCTVYCDALAGLHVVTVDGSE